jgi:dTDP-4-amino-4,6-dideoxygalactose transaminase
LQPVFADCPYYGDNTEGRLFDDGLCLPSGPALTNEDIARVATIIKEMY